MQVFTTISASIRFSRKKPVKAHSHQARLRPSTDVNALKIEPCSILSASTDVDGRLRPTDVDGRLRPSTPCWLSNGKRCCGTWQGHEYSIKSRRWVGIRCWCWCAFQSWFAKERNNNNVMMISVINILLLLWPVILTATPIKKLLTN